MRSWPRYPIIYEINTWTWLTDLSSRERRPIKLDQVPTRDWDAIAAFRPDAVWLMGIWTRSSEGVRIAREHTGLQDEYRRALPGFRPSDVVGSPFAVRRYDVDPFLGGRAGLVAARQALARRGIGLVLDFVPNHVACDHIWVQQRPELLMQGDREDLHRQPQSFFAAAGRVFAHGRDPYHAAWTDTVQLNAFRPEVRDAAVEILQGLARQCDGVRCDMAMLLINQCFLQTWGVRAGPTPASEYWPQIIDAVRREHPDFQFLAEAYWDLEWELQQQGFDACYDKRLYERLVSGPADAVQNHLKAEMTYQARLVRFLENHDEPRAASVFTPAQEQAAAVVMSTIPGARLFHQGQFEGARTQLPVQLGRRPPEPVDAGLHAFYQTLLAIVAEPIFHEGEWALCERHGWPDNQTYRNLLCWAWRHGQEYRWIVVNLSENHAQGQITFPWPGLPEPSCRLIDLLTGDAFARETPALTSNGLYVDLAPWACHLLRIDSGA